MSANTIPPRVENLKDRKFERLVVRAYAGARQKPCGTFDHLWICDCACGSVSTVSGGHLRSGHTTSCGCASADIARKRMTRHGRAGSRMHRVWQQMKQRCYNKKCGQFFDYGGRGITVCDRWLGRDGFENFSSDMGNPPGPGRWTVERKNNDAGYSPNNCVWATYRQQMRNRRSNHLITFQGRTMCMLQWAEEKGLTKSALKHRIRRKWPIEKALTTPMRSTAH